MIKLKVTAMTCQRCEKAGSVALASVSGVNKMDSVSHEKNEIKIRRTPDIDTVIATVKEEGLEVGVLL